MKTCKNCKHYKKDERIGIKVCEFGLHERYCEKNKEDFAIEELEKIKAEILEVFKTDKNCEVGLSFATDLIDEHISELKGE